MISLTKRLRAAAVVAGVAGSCVAACIALAHRCRESLRPLLDRCRRFNRRQRAPPRRLIPTLRAGGRRRAPPSPAPMPSAPRRRQPPASCPPLPARRALPQRRARPSPKSPTGSGTLPNDQRATQREYDITPYTLRVTSTNRPEQAIVDWILRETGYEAWHSDPVGLLSADHRTLRVYHTPEMQAVVAQMVDRFVNSAAETHAFGLRVVGVQSPSWRAKAQRILRPVPVQSQGIQAWLVAKEDASLLLADLRKRSDFREYNLAPYLLVNNGQSTTVNTMQTRSYTNGIELHPKWPIPAPVAAAGKPASTKAFRSSSVQLLSIDSKIRSTRCVQVQPRPDRKTNTGHDRRADRDCPAAAHGNRKCCRNGAATACTSDSTGRWIKCS